MKYILLITILLINILTNAQNFTIKGVITDERGEPVAFANIRNSKTGTTTDASGKFSLATSVLPIKITISSIGYESTTFVVNRSNYDSLKLTLRQALKNLEEVVVVTGYLSSRKRSVSSPVSSSYSTPTVLDAKVAGVEISGKKDTKYYANSSKSKLLTAAELNDFTKWTLWNDYNKDDFSRFVKQYQTSYTNRYSVQLINHKKQPLINKVVTLKNTKNDSIFWTAITDNTGKAELWNATNQKLKDKDLVLVIDRFQHSIHSFMDGVNVIELQYDCNINDKVDIAFIVDATGSMQDEINYLKDELQDIIEKVSASQKSTSFRFSSIFYRDFGDAYVTKYLPFTNNVKELTDYIALQNAGGGGDYPEAVVPALQTGIDSLQWDATAKARIAFLILDAPPHDYEAAAFNILIQQYAQKGIRVVPVVCSGAEKSVEFLMRNAALATNGVYTFLTDDSGIGDKHMKPTTDEFKVLLLNELMIQIINRMIYTPKCDATKKELTIENPFIDIIKKSNEVKVYPNPTRGYCRLESEESIQTIYIADFTGKILQRITDMNKSKEEIDMDLSKYPAGTYIIRYECEDGSKGSVKVVKI